MFSQFWGWSPSLLIFWWRGTSLELAKNASFSRSRDLIIVTPAILIRKGQPCPTSSAPVVYTAVCCRCIGRVADHNSIRNPPSAQHFLLWICKVNAISSTVRFINLLLIEFVPRVTCTASAMNNIISLFYVNKLTAPGTNFHSTSTTLCGIGS